MKTKLTGGYVFMAASLDGFVARENHSLDWLMKYDTSGEDHGYKAFIKTIDVLVMGSGSYKTVLSFDSWPYEMHVFVMSRTLSQKDIPEALKNKVTITNLTPRNLMDFLYSEGMEKAYVDGGKLVQSFISDGLIDEITITHIPILIGTGKRLFGSITEDVDLDLVSSKILKPGFVQSFYKVLANKE